MKTTKFNNTYYHIDFQSKNGKNFHLNVIHDTFKQNDVLLHVLKVKYDCRFKKGSLAPMVNGNLQCGPDNDIERCFKVLQQCFKGLLNEMGDEFKKKDELDWFKEICSK